MKKLPLTNSDQFTTVDIEDYRWARHYKWHVDTGGHVFRLDDFDHPIYLCNEVMSRAHYVPLSHFQPPKDATGVMA